MTYHAHLSPRSLTTVTDPIRQYPEHWELFRWYACWRKYPYPSEVIAALVVETRDEEYRHYPCPLEPHHWHIGRKKASGNWLPSAKRRYRKAVRDEIWREHVVRQEEAARG